MPGDFCGLHAAILDKMDHAIGTLTPCTMVEITPATIKGIVDGHPNIARALRWAALVDEATLREWLVNMGQRPSDRQLAHLLCELRVRLATVGMAGPDSFQLPVTQEELADTLGITHVYVNRVLQQLRDAALIKQRGRTIFMPDLQKLEEFAEFNPNYLHLTSESLVPRHTH